MKEMKLHINRLIYRRVAMCTATFVFVTSIGSAMIPALATGNSTDLFPLTQGSRWSYKSLDSKGKTWKSQFTVSSVKPGKDGNMFCTLAVVEGSQSSTQFYFKRATSVFLERVEFKDKPAEKVVYKPAKLLIDSNIRPNSVWQWGGQIEGRPAESERFKAYPGERIKVPAGEFDCARVESMLVRDRQLIYYTRWFSLGVGLVKMVVATKNGKFTQELTAFKVN